MGGDPRDRGAAPAGGPLQQGLFEDYPPSFPRLARPAAERIGVIDVGSNTVRLVVFEGDERSPAVLFNEKVACRLGEGLAETGRLSAEGRVRALATLGRFAALAAALGVGELEVVATAAVREARDGSAFCDEVAQHTGLRVTVTSGEDEARLAALGLLFGNPGARGVVADVGGASLELCRVGGGAVGDGVTLPLGTLRLQAIPRNERRAAIDGRLASLPDELWLGGGRLFLTGGAWRALARVEMARRKYPLEVLHEFTLTAGEVRALADHVLEAPASSLAEVPGVSRGRVPLLPGAALLLVRLLERLEAGSVMFSAFGLREGVCFARLPEPVRQRDPLIAACEAQEQLRARAPGFGRELSAWTLGALPAESEDEARLVSAAARLADVNWRNHPDYRVVGAWEAVTRASITDVGHAGRIFMGLALAERYGGGPKIKGQRRLARLLGHRRSGRAALFGRAFRLGIGLSAALPGILPTCPLQRQGDRLVLRLEGAAARLAGEEVERRLVHLARAGGWGAEMRVVR